jgi:hypothetical protein
MAALTSLSDLVNRMTGGNSGTPENIFWFKNYTIGGTADSWVAGLMYSFWKYDGFPGGGANPTTVAAPTNATAGAMPFTDPGGGREKWLVGCHGIAGQVQGISSLLLYDRLLHIGSLDGTVATAQTVGGSLTRNTGGVGNQIFVEIYTNVGTTARTITATYTNSTPTGSRTTQAVTFGGTASTLGNDANLFIQLPLQAGDVGVSSVQSVTISASTGTAGNFGVTVARPIAWIPMNGRAMGSRDFTTGLPGMPELETGSCLALAGLVNSSAECVFNGMLATVEA